MIERLSIAALQSHRGSELAFGPGMNVIVGSSDAGKSAVLRALRWVCENRPAGDGLVPHGGEEADVELSVDGVPVRRFKGKSTNAYQLAGRELVAFGRGVPDEVSELLNVEDVNFHRQMDPPFLLTLSGQEITRYLNRMVDLDVIGASLKRAVSEEREATRQVQALSASIGELEAEVASHDEAVQQDRTVRRLRRSLDLVNEHNARAARLRKLAAVHKSATTALALHPTSEELRRAMVALGVAGENAAQAKIAGQRAAALRGLGERHTRAADKLARMPGPKTLATTGKAVEQLREDVEAVGEQASIAQSLRRKARTYSSTLLELEDTAEEHRRAAIVLGDSMPAVCPLCGRGDQ